MKLPRDGEGGERADADEDKVRYEYKQYFM